MNWKELLNQPDEFLNDPKNSELFNLKGHPEFPYISDLDEAEVLAILQEFLIAENQPITIANLLNYAPILEMTLIKKNLPSIYG
ncbi:hypothetical protein [Leptospira idonii]|uniref:Uncharacterized protein n=1 Tax=Leptospira idonii TaxID=1193500 RepID=A0A4R9LZB2_9LEPT|nr:hypothetical protein [Leptospira idonii]TGN19700.1 hypothetical protein EHS15_07945 [Leptospira idonii]